MARPERFELPTYSSGGCRSIQLSYGRVFQVYIGRLDPSICARRNEKRRNEKTKERRNAENWFLRNVRSPFAFDYEQDKSCATSSLTASPALAAATAARTLGLRTSFVHINSASADLASIQACNGFVPFFGICHLYETESP
jgi:hypothetical protein